MLQGWDSKKKTVIVTSSSDLIFVWNFVQSRRSFISWARSCASWTKFVLSKKGKIVRQPQKWSVCDGALGVAIGGCYIW